MVTLIARYSLINVSLTDDREAQANLRWATQVVVKKALAIVAEELQMNKSACIGQDAPPDWVGQADLPRSHGARSLPPCGGRFHTIVLPEPDIQIAITALDSNIWIV